MAAYAALVSLLNNIHTITKNPRLSTCLDDELTQPLLQKTNFLLDFIEGNNHGAGSKEVADLERQIASAAHSAEDLIESHIADQIQAGTSEAMPKWPYLLMLLLNCVGCDRFGKSLDLQQSIQEMGTIVKKVAAVNKKMRSKEEQEPAHLAGSVTNSGGTAMVGLDTELKKLLHELTGDQSSRRIMAIVGMGGSGKTTLAKNVYENLLIKEHFQFRAWATISQQINAKEVLLKLLSGLGLGELIDATVDDLGLQLHKNLSGRRYLIVLDDIWSVIAWDAVKRFFPDNRNASRILLTTRLSNVGKDCGSSLLNINLLDEANSWKLFCEKAFQDKHCPLELLKVGEEIVKSCKGLALSIVVIGGLLLKSPKTVGHWKGVAKDLKSISNSKEKQESLDVLSLSYNHLPPHLKPCFLYMGVFKEDSEISISRIIRFWVGEGFIKPIRSRVLEEIAEGFIKDLIDRNLIFVYKPFEDEEIEFCGIHDLLRELCIKLAKEEGFFQVFDYATRGIVHCVFDGMHLGRAEVRLPHLRSIMTTGCIQDPTKYRLLRVLDKNILLDSEGVNCYWNFNLRYISYKLSHSLGFSKWELSSSVSLLWNLQSLIIENFFGPLIIVPAEFWKMQQLRHVECHKLYVPSPPLSSVQDGSLMLDNLQTFKEIVNLGLSEEVCKIISNIKDLHLIYDHELKGYDGSFVESLCNLDRLHKLDSLYVKGSRESLFPDRELEMKRTTSFPSSLKKLSLSYLSLECDDMTIIGSLPQLEVLELGNITAIGEGRHWSPVEGQFRHLKILSIYQCDLICLDAEESHFPVLEKLFLRWLLYLEEIPLCIGDISTLEFIQVNCCTNSAAISAIRIKEDQLDYGGQLQVQVEVRRSLEESFNQMLEREELTVDNISFKRFN